MLVTARMPRSMSAEAYRSLRTSIKYSSIDKEIKTLVVTSSVPGEGKSTVSSNLGMSLSQNGDKVLIIDCDLRKPSLHKKFRISNQKGLTDLLIYKDECKGIIHKIDENLSIIPTGTIPPNPAEVIGSKTLEEFINKMKQSFDYIILDAPPLLAVTDPQLLAAKADGTIMVIRAHKTKGKLVVKAYKELEKVNANIIGSVLNARETNKIDLYSYYYEEGEKNKKRKKRRNL